MLGKIKAEQPNRPPSPVLLIHDESTLLVRLRRGSGGNRSSRLNLINIRAHAAPRIR